MLPLHSKQVPIEQKCKISEMNPPRNTEPQANGALANLLKRLHPDWNDDTLHAERTNVIQLRNLGSDPTVGKSVSSGKGKQPDILIAPPRRQPVIVETEFHPAPSVEQDAIERLGVKLRSTGEEIEGVLSVILPETLKSGSLDLVEHARFRYATHYLNHDSEISRWPANGEWLEGGIEELADTIEFMSISPRKIAAGTTNLEDVVRNSAALLDHYASNDVLVELAKKMNQETGEQTVRMIAAIFVSAFVFHTAIEEQAQIPNVPLNSSISKNSLLKIWSKILEVNYWPVFSIARDLLEILPVTAVPPVMNRIAESISDLVELGATSYHDLTGRMFQTLITDRKFLATFYTLPESACLLAELAVNRLEIDWSDKTQIEKLRIADFACGTGALLSAVQRSIYRRYRRAGGDDKELHKAMMERVLVGFDIMPAATHLSCSILSSCYPSLYYGESSIHTMPYGIDGGKTHIGSLDLLTEDHSYSLFATGDTLSSIQSEASPGFSVTAKNNSFDMVIMNPPFTRPTNHKGSERDDTPIPSFAGFNTSHDEQRAMSSKLRRSKPEFGHGNAGLASNFMDLGHRKLAEGGILALVLPFAATRGQGWEKARKALDSSYDDIHVVSIATTGEKDSAFSADTGMAECLVVATKRSKSNKTTYYSNLRARPTSILEATLEAGKERHKVETGGILEAGYAGVLSSNIIETSQRFRKGKLLLPRLETELPISVVTLGKVARRGLYSLDINGEPPRGAFEIRKLEDNEIPEYPALWNHQANRERKLVVHPDTCGDVMPENRAKASSDWKRTASRLHWNVDFRLSSQSLAMCLTPDKCLGGTAWPNVIANDEEHEIPILLWSNSTLGLLMHWWKGTRQQQGRSRVQITAIPEYLILDPRSLTNKQIELCDQIYSNLNGKEFLPANEAYRDDVRKELDRVLLCDLLGFSENVMDSLEVLRNQWCAEPSVHGGKSTRI